MPFFFRKPHTLFPRAVFLQPDSEEGDEIVFCDGCNVCVHQQCYGVEQIPEGPWFCNACARPKAAGTASCVLCPRKGGALKPTTTAKQWVHVCCALWVPEAIIEDEDAMEPIDLRELPRERFSQQCSLCQSRKGATIQCSVSGGKEK